MLQTLGGISQLSTHHSSFSDSPGVKTHSTPHIVHADLHSAFILNVTSYQPQLTSYTWNCMQYRTKVVQLIITFRRAQTEERIMWLGNQVKIAMVI